MLKAFVPFVVIMLPFVIPIFITGEEIAAAFGLVFYGLVYLAYRLWKKTPSYQKKKAKQEAEQREREMELAELNTLYTFNQETGVFTLLKRSPLLAKVIQIKDSSDIFIAYKPVTLHVGAATVGGVTTGGAYTTGGYNYISGEKKNGLCTLECDGVVIRKIQLTYTLWQKAKDSIVASYLNEETRQLDVVNDVRLDAIERQFALNSLKTQGYVGNKAAHAGYPTITKGLKIMDWLTTED